MSQDPHADLLAACGRGDRGALAAIYQREAPAMLGVALRIVRRRELAEEVVHDAFVQIWRHAGRFDPALGSGRGWIFAIVRNRAINAVRDTGREQPTEDTLLDALAEAGDVLSEYQNRIADESALKTCLERLDPRRRLGVLLAYVEGLTHGEIAARLGVPLGTAKAWIRRSLIDLRECLA